MVKNVNMSPLEGEKKKEKETERSEDREERREVRPGLGKGIPLPWRPLERDDIPWHVHEK